MTKDEHMQAWRAGATNTGIPAERIADDAWVKSYRRGQRAAQAEDDSFLAGPDTWPSRDVLRMFGR